MSALLFCLALASVPEADPVIDGAITLGSGSAAAALFFLHPVLVDPTCPCEERNVNALDRPTTANEWVIGEPLADAVLMLAVALPLVASAVEAEHWVDLLNDCLLVLESAALASLATQIAKTAVARPYPYMYERTLTAEQLGDGDNYASFWSGHTAVAMAAGTSFTALAWKRHSKLRWLGLVATPIFAAAAGSLQLSAGNHFPTDLAAGAAAGALIGLLDIWLHS
jgi:membrane-associated phospholipid phosphatase